MKKPSSNPTESTNPTSQVPLAMRRARAIRRAHFSAPATDNAEHTRQSVELIVDRLKRAWADEDAPAPAARPRRAPAKKCRLTSEPKNPNL